MQFFAMTIYICVAETLPFSFHLLVFTFQFVCGAGIIFNTRGVICCSVVDGELGGVVMWCREVWLYVVYMQFLQKKIKDCFAQQQN